MTDPAPLLVARSAHDLVLLPGLANRHGLVAGATGTGKTVTLRVLAEGFSRIGVPVFLADVKGDLSGVAKPGGDSDKVQARAKELGLPLQPEAYPVAFLDPFGEAGHPLRTTVSEMGPLLLGRVLGLNDTQAGVLQIAFRVADEGGLLLLDVKDLRAILEHVSQDAAALRQAYGNVSPTTVGAIQRSLLALEAEGADRLFGEPALALEDLFRTDLSGRGQITILDAQRLFRSPRLYATVLLWLLSELFEHLPEVGDPEKPRLVFFFDEAHLLFEDAPDELRQRIEQVVRLVRSKGVGVYLVTQNPLDVPDAVLGQLGNRVQHALRAFTPRDQKAVRAAAETFRANPGVDVEKAITELAVGEALVSLLDAKGTPTPVERAFVVPPRSRLAPLTAEERAQVLQSSPLRGR
jgi:DNA helicase HerA-like ATPase